MVTNKCYGNSVESILREARNDLKTELKDINQKLDYLIELQKDLKEFRDDTKIPFYR